MKVTVATLLVVPALLLAGCSGGSDDKKTEPAARATSASVPTLEPLWSVPLFSPPTGGSGGGVDAVSHGHFIGGGSVDDSAGFMNPTPNRALDYGIGDAETGTVTTMRPLTGMPGTLRAIPGTDLFVAVAPTGWEIRQGRPRVTGYTIGVVDPATSSFKWRHRAAGKEVVGLTATRIYLGHDTSKGAPICLTVDGGEVVRDQACLDSVFGVPDEVDGVRLSDNSRTIDLPEGKQITVPVTYATDVDSSDRLWSSGDSSTTFQDDQLGYDYSTFVIYDAGLLRVDYRYRGDDPEAGAGSSERPWPDAVLRLVDPRTGKATHTFGRVPAGTLQGIAGDVAIFEHAYAPGLKAAGYRLTLDD